LVVPWGTSGEEIAVDSVIAIPRQPDSGTEPTTAILDVRRVPLAALATDSDAQAMVGRIMERMDGRTRLSVAMFNSAI
jgi:FXSXX-COOH protein